jgi:aconitate hydratase
MGAELGATTSIFPSDEKTFTFLKAQKREKDWIPLSPDPDANYDEIWEIDLEKLEPLIARPHSPDREQPKGLRRSHRLPGDSPAGRNGSCLPGLVG